MSGHLFDTCIVRNWYGRNAVVEAHVNSLPDPSPLYVSSITLGEIEYSHLNPAATDLAKQAAFRRWIRETFEDSRLSITDGTAIEYAKFRRRLFDRFERRGRHPENCEDQLGAKLNVDTNDLWLVAQACERNLVFVTNDKMERIRAIVDDDVRILVWPDH